MQILHKDLNKLEFKLKIESAEDLWYLSQIIEQGDLLQSRTFRKIKLNKSDERSNSIIKKPVILEISVEKIEFHKYSDILRASGKITKGPDDIPFGSYHTINLEENTIFNLTKKELYNYQIEKLNEASEKKRSDILICIHDRESAIFAELAQTGYKIIAKIKGSVPKKSELNSNIKDFYDELKNYIIDRDSKKDYESIIIGSPSFWKEYLMKKLENDKIKEKIVTASCSVVGSTGIMEILKRPEVKSALKQDRISREAKEVDKLLAKISKKGAITYGFEETKKAAVAGAIESLLLTDGLIHELRQKEDFSKLDQLMKTVDKNTGKIMIISSDHEGGKKLDGLGGIASTLRYRLEY